VLIPSLRLRLAGALVCLGFATINPAGAQTSFVAFESGPVRPLALSPDGTRLFAVNTPDNRLEVFAVSASGLTPIDSIPVGMEPVAVAARSNTQVWVVNHLSDSVSIVDLAATPPRVARTLLVGDEPRDIVFAGSGESQAITETVACNGFQVPRTRQQALRRNRARRAAARHAPRRAARGGALLERRPDARRGLRLRLVPAEPDVRDGGDL
jgi:YVTN family beta-propeller protein